LWAGSKIFNPPVPMVTAVAVADVRAGTFPSNGSYEHDPLQETQLLAGEPVLVFEQKGEWVRIEAPEQQEFTHHSRWEGYPGWVKKKDLTKDLNQHHRLKKLNVSTDELRKKILEAASLHIGQSYLWGGRSLHDPANKSVATGVDCSGLINWSFRQVGWFIPRDAHEQFMRATPIDSKELKPADLIFLADEKNPQKITHVAFYAGGDEILEAPQTGETVRRISSQDRFGKSTAALKKGDIINGKVVSFGSFFMEDK
jgi:hypothetical protein